MTDIAATILGLGKELDLDERAVVAHKLLATLHDESDSRVPVDTAWSDESRRRINDIESGRIEPVSHAETVAMAREIAAGRR